VIDESLKRRAKRIKTNKEISTFDINDLEVNFVESLSEVAREVK
jgi:hypothetical protein